MRRSLLWLLPVGLLFVPAFPDPPLRSGAYVQDVRRDSAVLAFIAASARPLAGEVRDSAQRVVWQAAAGDARRRHALQVRGLAPGESYSFRLLDAGGAELDAGVFSTPPAEDTAPVEFLVVGDSGGQPWWVWLQNNALFGALARTGWLPPKATVAGVGANMAAEPAQFWLHVGDIVYPWGRQAQYAPGFFQPFAELLRRAPCYPVLGNHDIVDDGGRQALQNFHLPRSELSGDERCYSFAWGPVRVVALDINRAVAADDPALAILDHELAGATEPWRVVITHYPLYSASRHRDRPDLLEHLAPRLVRHRVDLYLSGHDHNYQRFAPLAEGSGPVPVVTGAGGKSLYELHPHPRLRASYGGYHYLRVAVRGARLDVTAVDLDGAVRDSFALDLRQRAARTGFAPDSDGRDRRIAALLRDV